MGMRILHNERRASGGRLILALVVCAALFGCGRSEEYHYELALRYMASGDHARAIEEMQAAVKANPHSARAHNQLGILYGKVGLYDRAAVECRRATEIDSSFASAYYNLGVIYQANLARPAEAVLAYRRYLQLNPRGKRAEAVRRIVEGLMRRAEVRKALSESLPEQRELAERYAADEKYAEAIEVYKKMLARAPRSASHAHLEIAKIYEEKFRQPEKALKHYQAYLERNINAPDAADIMAAIGRLREKVVLAPTPTRVSRDSLREAERLLKEKKGPEAMALLEKARRESPESEQVHDLLAEAYMAVGDLKGAEKEYEWLKARQADFAYGRELAGIYSSLAASDVKRADYRRAAERLAKAIEISGEDAHLRWEFSRALAAQGKFQRALEEAALARSLPGGEAEAAEMTTLYLNYARHLSGRGQYERAVEMFKEAKALSPDIDLSADMADLCEARARIARDSGMLAAAEKEYLKALQLARGRWRIHGELASINEQMGQYEKALKEWQKVASRGKEGASAFREMARISEEFLGERTKALKYYRRYLELAATAKDADEIKKKLEDAERDRKKIVEYERAVKRKPESATTRYNLAVLLQRQGKLREAIKEYQKALALEPTNAQAHFNIAYSYDRLRMYDRAISEYRKAIQYKPDYVKAYNNLAAIYKAKGWYGKAIASFTKALKIDPGYAQAHLGLGAIYADELKQRQKAVYHYRQYLRLRPNGTFAPQVRSWLRGAA